MLFLVAVVYVFSVEVCAIICIEFARSRAHFVVGLTLLLLFCWDAVDGILRDNRNQPNRDTMQSDSFVLEPEVQNIVRTALHDVLVAEPQKPLTFLAARLKLLNAKRKLSSLPEPIVETLRNHFDTADRDADDKITLEEYVLIRCCGGVGRLVLLVAGCSPSTVPFNRYLKVRKTMSRRADVIFSDEAITEDFQRVDSNKSGSIDFNEFLIAYVMQQSDE